MPQVVIYTRQGCGYCTAAKRLLGEKGIDFVEHDATQNPDMRTEMNARSGRFTFPQIFIGNHHVGGCDDLYALEREGRLDPLLVAA